MGTPIIRVRDENGNYIDIPAIRGPQGEKGEKGDPGVGMGNITAADVKCTDGRSVEEQLAELWQGDASMTMKIEVIGAHEYMKNINPDTTGFATLLEYMASRYDDHPVIRGYISGFSDIPEPGQGEINLCGGLLTATINTLTMVYHRGTNSLTTWTGYWWSDMPAEGYGGLASGVDLRTLGNGWYILQEGYTYANAPADFAGLGVLTIKDKTAEIRQMNTGMIWFSSNISATTPPWGKVYSEVYKPTAADVGLGDVLARLTALEAKNGAGL